MCQGVLEIPGIFAERGSQHKSEDDPRESYGYGSDEFDHVPRGGYGFLFHKEIQTDRADDRDGDVGLDGEVHEDAASAHEEVPSGRGAYDSADCG